MAHAEVLCTVSGEIRASGESSHERVIPHDPILSDEAREVLEIIFNVALNSSIGALGSVLNVINIIIFYKQGFSDSVNVSLCALAVSDLGCLLPMMWVGICSNPLFQYSDIDFDSVEINYLTGGLPHSCFVRTTGLITAFVTSEICVCVALPLKVKTIITPKRTLISVVAMFAIIFAAVTPLLCSIDILPYFHAKRNKTLIGPIYTSNTAAFQNFSYIFNVFAQLSCFVFVTICTVILVLNLISKSQWRQKAISVSDVPDSISTRNKKITKMVIFLSSIFIACYFHSVVNLLLFIHLPSQYSPTGTHANTYVVYWSIINTVEEINSSVTILIYYNMSSKFRKSFNYLFSTSIRSPVVAMTILMD